MSNKNEEGRQEAEANPYNRKKSWHTDDAMPQDRTSADEGLFVPCRVLVPAARDLGRQCALA